MVMVVAVVVALATFCTISHGFSASSPTTSSVVNSRTYIELINPLFPTTGTTGSNRLPVSYVQTWPTYILDLSNCDNNSNSPTEDITAGSKSSGSSTYPWTWSRIPDGSSCSESTSESESKSSNTTSTTATTAPTTTGYVNPITFDTLWHPIDLIAPQMQLAIGLHIRNGQVRHILPAIDLFYSNNNNNNKPASECRMHRNRGLYTVPRAYQWMEFSAYMSGGIGISRVSGDLEINTQPVTASTTGEPLESTWTKLQSIHTITDIVDMALTAIASNPPNELQDGSCIVHVLPPPSSLIEHDVQQQHPLQCPIQTGDQIRVVLTEHTDEEKTTSSNANDDDDRLVVVGTLNVQIETIAAGSESEYRPECYTPLYTNPELLVLS